MKTTRTHSRGKPFRRDIPEGCKTKTDWGKEGFILKPDAKPAAWILMGDNYHEYAVFAADQVEPGSPPKQGHSRVTEQQLEKLFEQYEELVPNAELYQDPPLYYIEIDEGITDHGHPHYSTLYLSGRYDSRAGRITSRGSRAKAYECLKMFIDKARAEKREPV